MAHTTHEERAQRSVPPATSHPGNRGSRRSVWLVIGATIVVLALVAGGYVVWDRNWRTAGPSNPGVDCPVVVRAGPRRPLAMPGVDRVTLIGDSIMDQASCAVGRSLAGVGVETYRHAVGGSGLLNSLIDWVTSAQALLAAEHPDVVVAIFVGNYLPPTHAASGQRIEVDTPAFFTAWQQRAEALSRVVRASGAKLYWVSPPPIALPPLNHAQRLFDGYRTIAGDHFLNSGQSLAGDRGNEVTGTSTCGRARTIRTFDRVHLTPDGARIYGQMIAHDLSADLGVLTTPRPC